MISICKHWIYCFHDDPFGVIDGSYAYNAIDRQTYVTLRHVYKRGVILGVCKRQVLDADVWCIMQELFRLSPADTESWQSDQLYTQHFDEYNIRHVTAISYWCGLSDRLTTLTTLTSIVYLISYICIDLGAL